MLGFRATYPPAQTAYGVMPVCLWRSVVVREWSWVAKNNPPYGHSVRVEFPDGLGGGYGEDEDE